MAYFVVEVDSDVFSSEEAENFLMQIKPIKSFKEITEGNFVKELR